MPKVSKDSAPDVADFGAAVDRSAHMDGYTVNFVSIRETHDLGPILANLPTGRCTCPHWGYVVKGRITMRFADHDEVVEAGDAFYFPPGHAPEAEAGTELVQFSPSAELDAVVAGMRQAMQASEGQTR
jgi:mannose-6-phosphate isomerase-like protein (cupin superfamily)